MLIDVKVCFRGVLDGGIMARPERMAKISRANVCARFRSFAPLENGIKSAAGGRVAQALEASLRVAQRRRRGFCAS
jgi:hypothetical protein